jgi:hypothetical protein
MSYRTLSAIRSKSIDDEEIAMTVQPADHPPTRAPQAPTRQSALPPWLPPRSGRIRPVANPPAPVAESPRPLTVTVQVTLASSEALATAAEVADRFRDLAATVTAELGAGVEVTTTAAVVLDGGRPRPGAEPPRLSPVRPPVSAASPSGVGTTAPNSPVRGTGSSGTAGSGRTGLDTSALRIYPAQRSALHGASALTFTRREYDLLLFLAENAGRVFTRAQLLRSVWHHAFVSGERTVDVHVRRVRAKLREGGPVITTVRGIGYRLDHADRVAVIDDTARPA